MVSPGVLPAAPLPKPAPLTEEELGPQSGGAAFPKSGDTRPRSESRASFLQAEVC